MLRLYLVCKCGNMDVVFLLLLLLSCVVYSTDSFVVTWHHITFISGEVGGLGSTLRLPKGVTQHRVPRN